MVYPDISTDENPNIKAEYQSATPTQRLLAVVIDYFIFSPIVSFLCVIIFSQGLKLYKQFPSSPEATVILIQIGVGVVFLFTLIQAIFIFFAGGTPGQIFTKTFVSFDLGQQPRYSLHIFFQCWFRQIGFAISVLCLGIPFLAIFYHQERRTIYEKATESSVLTTVVKPFEILNWGDSERKYVSVFAATFLFFSAGLLIWGFQNFYQKILTSNLSYEKLKTEKQFCSEMDSIQQQNRLNVATALNLVGVLSDRCLDLESDFILWKNFNVSINSESRSLAYFAKYLTADDDDNESEYLNKACTENQDSQACQYAQNFKTGNFYQLLSDLNRINDKNVLAEVLKYEIMKELQLNTTDSLEQIKKYSTFKLFNKYVISEQLSNLTNSSNSRSPASMSDVSEQINEIQKRIDDL